MTEQTLILCHLCGQAIVAQNHNGYVVVDHKVVFALFDHMLMEHPNLSAEFMVKRLRERSEAKQ